MRCGFRVCGAVSGFAVRFQEGEGEGDASGSLFFSSLGGVIAEFQTAFPAPTSLGLHPLRGCCLPTTNINGKPHRSRLCLDIWWRRQPAQNFCATCTKILCRLHKNFVQAAQKSPLSPHTGTVMRLAPLQQLRAFVGKKIYHPSILIILFPSLAEEMQTFCVFLRERPKENDARSRATVGSRHPSRATMGSRGIAHLLIPHPINISETDINCVKVGAILQEKKRKM